MKLVSRYERGSAGVAMERLFYITGLDRIRFRDGRIIWRKA